MTFSLMQDLQYHDKFQFMLEANMATLPKFPGELLKNDVQQLIKKFSQELYDWAKVAKEFAKQQGYQTKILDVTISNPEGMAKQLIKRYASQLKDQPMKFKLSDLLKDIDLDLQKGNGA